MDTWLHRLVTSLRLGARVYNEARKVINEIFNRLGSTFKLHELCINVTRNDYSVGIGVVVKGVDKTMRARVSAVGSVEVREASNEVDVEVYYD